MKPLRIGLLAAPSLNYINPIRDHVEALQRYSKHSFELIVCEWSSQEPPATERFDVLVQHYGIKAYIQDFLADDWRDMLANHKGPAVLYFQDEYHSTSKIHAWIKAVQPAIVWTPVPAESIHLIYSPDLCPKTHYHSMLTGFLPEHPVLNPPQIADRPVVLGYRGRQLGIQYGKLGREKAVIGQVMREFCEERDVKCDIEWTEDRRIYDAQWPEFLCMCRAMLASESGSNIWDRDDILNNRIRLLLGAEKTMTFAQLYERLGLADLEGVPCEMNQISAKVFEAIANKTALVLYEGAWSGVLEPDRHYIPLQKEVEPDNIDEVFRRLDDTKGLQELVDRTHEEIALDPRYTYRAHVEAFDAALEAL